MKSKNVNWIWALWGTLSFSLLNLISYIHIFIFNNQFFGNLIFIVNAILLYLVFLKFFSIEKETKND